MFTAYLSFDGPHSTRIRQSDAGLHSNANPHSTVLCGERIELRESEQPLAVAEQDFLKHRFGEVHAAQLVEAALWVDEGIVAAEDELVLQPAFHVAHHLGRDVAGRPAGDVDV